MSEPQAMPRPKGPRSLWDKISVAAATAPTEFVELTAEQAKARKRRNLIIAWSIIAFVVLVFAITLAQMAAHSGGRAS
ncbi:MAG TPA: hypothetical protein VHC73_01970 [Vitreimonas sp.]|jgi:hypothetical protein|nr:hypothetical protein [Vitreimonas sp.]